MEEKIKPTAHHERSQVRGGRVRSRGEEGEAWKVMKREEEEEEDVSYREGEKEMKRRRIWFLLC